jgi:hypothetical protein
MVDGGSIYQQKRAQFGTPRFLNRDHGEILRSRKLYEPFGWCRSRGGAIFELSWPPGSQNHRQILCEQQKGRFPTFLIRNFSRISAELIDKSFE